jgi:hypothetical protein
VVEMVREKSRNRGEAWRRKKQEKRTFNLYKIHKLASIKTPLKKLTLSQTLNSKQNQNE